MNLSVDENIKKLQNYILYPELLIHEPLPDVVPRKFDENRLLQLPQCPSTTRLVPRRDYTTGDIVEYVEVDLDDVGANAVNSTSMQREPGLLDEATRGSAMNCPFWPGGFDEPSFEMKHLDLGNFDLGTELLNVPPGFTSGYDFSEKLGQKEKIDNFKNVNLLTNLERELKVDDWFNAAKSKDGNMTTPHAKDINFSTEFKDFDDNIMSNELKPILKISNATINFSSEWAEMVDITQPISDFKQKIPCPAMLYPFELDVFQKQAILKLEERQYVFVAAHTSAGKTVVAEYAIALSKRDLTRTIYTSPIKALSNQKYRDFKKSFKDVGLITGDLQIDPTSSCLIMTTEILRSMLYCGSDITRDLEYVIFDEVHYINNPERGHVWEEVIILLPDHVNIIMLSATVPNTMELADWVGSTKKRKVYVISTLNRPVPLMHYLYTGSGGKSKDDIFLLVDEHAKFLQTNYEKAVERKKEMQSKIKSGRGGAGGGAKNFVSAKQDQNIWIGLIDFLKRNDNMPVVAFTLSRNRCDTNAQALQSVDLNTAREKGAVQKFYQQCMQKLKPPDRLIPQVLTLKDSLERGIGVHHSGILPILKEIVEMLFQSGLVKLLFATETFAMGVNMPARTVIFDSHRKFDGVEVRNLKPGEYIQMAGRAGRRGHDNHGTVILLCKTDVPPATDLRPMILGQPEKLQSQFILRYAVILTCLRIESIKVEDIMQFSFKEFNQKLQKPAQQKQLLLAEDKFSKMPELGEHLKAMCRFYDLGMEYVIERQRLMKFLITQPKIVKELKIGRVLVVTHGTHYNKLGILLHIKSIVGKDSIYRVLVLDHQHKTIEQDMFNRGEMYYKMISLTPQHKFFRPDGICGHTILDIKAIDIVNITRTIMKVDADIIIRNWEQRQIERFKDSSPSASVVKTVTELEKLNDSYIENPESITYINISKELNVNSENELVQYHYIEHLERQLADVVPHTNVAGFEHEFATVFERRILEHKIEELKFKNSTKNLSLYPDYCNKLEVLRKLKYIDELDEVTLKGKVACEMGQNELLITELILCNMFNDLEPAEIAALLSGLVFQSKIQGEPVIPEKLKKCVLEFEAISDNILQKELQHQAIIETDSRLNFGLLEVVYEWARNKPFAEIMKLTEVQEGIIVRCIQQLDETLRDVKTAAIRIGNPALQTKMEEASNTIKRDIVFTASLYTEF